jgi:hypothetical protein
MPWAFPEARRPNIRIDDPIVVRRKPRVVEVKTGSRFSWRMTERREDDGGDAAIGHSSAAQRYNG